MLLGDHHFRLLGALSFRELEDLVKLMANGLQRLLLVDQVVESPEGGGDRVPHRRPQNGEVVSCRPTQTGHILVFHISRTCTQLPGALPIGTGTYPENCTSKRFENFQKHINGKLKCKATLQTTQHYCKSQNTTAKVRTQMQRHNITANATTQMKTRQHNCKRHNTTAKTTQLQTPHDYKATTKMKTPQNNSSEREYIVDST